ncbi:alpha-N-acetylgalactosaminide alpha-2,6-sialyltransferase 2-like [Leptodactylus fuscus]|uniref:alpha-N-acetylgalactosaminide alpha-2,6-sialyltransferase 2-like n=1 Tax=Leptodactylus fuscus TaxID=238119 RepID=UPI003F4EA3B6
MGKWVKMIPYRALHSKSLRKILLVLCLVSLLGLLVSHMDQRVRNESPTWASDYMSNIKEENFWSREIEEIPNTDIFPTKPRHPKVNTTTPSPKPPEKVKQPSMTNRTTTKKTIKSQKVPIKPINESLISKNGPTQRLNVTAKTQNASLPESIINATKLSQVNMTLYLGDKYATDETHVNSKCPNRTRDKLQSKEFKDMFLEKIPVLQWKKHAQESEYERLKIYNGAQGWMVVAWDILNETMNLLNSTGNAYMFDTWRGQSPCIRCAVVGGGGILNGSGMGQEIDSHDYVFRVNGAITKGFEKDVGNRTSFFVFSTNTLMNSLAAYRGIGFKSVPQTPETRYLILPDHNRDYLLVRAALTNNTIDQGRDKGKDPSKIFGKGLKTEHFKILHPDFMRYLRNRYLADPILKTKSRDIYRASTGATMLLAAIHTCDQVSAYGFMTPNYKKFSNHYYDSTHQRVLFFANHSFLREMALWQKLHKAGVMKLYMRD